VRILGGVLLAGPPLKDLRVTFVGDDSQQRFRRDFFLFGETLEFISLARVEHVESDVHRFFLAKLKELRFSGAGAALYPILCTKFKHL